MSIRRDVLDAKLLELFKTALTPEMLQYLVTATNQLLVELYEVTPQEIEALTLAHRQTEQELANLITCARLHPDGDSPTGVVLPLQPLRLRWL